MSLRITRPHAALFLAGAALTALPAHARANSVAYQISGTAVVVVADGGGADLDPLPDRIKFSINANGVTMGGATFHVSATIVAQADPPVTGKPFLTFSSLTITNTGGNVAGGTMWLQHDFAAIDKPSQWSAKLVGRFDSTVTPGNLAGGSLNYLTKVYSSVGGWKQLFSKNTGMVAGAAPIPFVLAGGPVGWKIVSKQRGELIFYLDSPGDSIFVTPADNSKFMVALVPLLFWPRRKPGT